MRRHNVRVPLQFKNTTPSRICGEYTAYYSPTSVNMQGGGNNSKKERLMVQCLGKRLGYRGRIGIW